MRNLVIGLVLGLAVAVPAGAVVHARTLPATTGIWADACVVQVSDASLYFPEWGYGSIKYVGAFVGNYDGVYLSDYAALNAVSGFDCQRSYY